MFLPTILIMNSCKWITVGKAKIGSSISNCLLTFYNDNDEADLAKPRYSYGHRLLVRCEFSLQSGLPFLLGLNHAILWNNGKYNQRPHLWLERKPVIRGKLTHGYVWKACQVHWEKVEAVCWNAKLSGWEIKEIIKEMPLKGGNIPSVCQSFYTLG